MQIMVGVDKRAYVNILNKNNASHARNRISVSYSCQRSVSSAEEQNCAPSLTSLNAHRAFYIGKRAALTGGALM